MLTTYKVTCDGVIIDAHWNCCSTVSELIGYFKEFCTCDPGKTYGIVRIDKTYYNDINNLPPWV